jgi:hypothetical protein
VEFDTNLTQCVNSTDSYNEPDVVVRSHVSPFERVFSTQVVARTTCVPYNVTEPYHAYETEYQRVNVKAEFANVGLNYQSAFATFTLTLTDSSTSGGATVTTRAISAAANFTVIRSALLALNSSVAYDLSGIVVQKVAGKADNGRTINSQGFFSELDFDVIFASSPGVSIPEMTGEVSHKGASDPTKWNVYVTTVEDGIDERGLLYHPFFNRTVEKDLTDVFAYSCDLVRLQPASTPPSKAVRWEPAFDSSINSNGTHGAVNRTANGINASRQTPSDEVTLYLWNASNQWSFLRTGDPTAGFAVWRDVFATSSGGNNNNNNNSQTTRIAAVNALDRIVAGVNAAMASQQSRASSPPSAHVAPINITAGQVRVIGAWLASQSTSPYWLEDQFLRQWMRGDGVHSASGLPLPVRTDLHPLRAGASSPPQHTGAFGWELAAETSKKVHGTNGLTIDQARYLWDPRNKGSFLNGTGHLLWTITSLGNGEDCSHLCGVTPCTQCITDAKRDLAGMLPGGEAANYGGTTFRYHMNTVSRWLLTWTTNRVLLSDILYKWAHDTCLPTAQAPPVQTVAATTCTGPSCVCVEGRAVQTSPVSELTSPPSTIGTTAGTYVYDLESPHTTTTTSTTTVDTACRNTTTGTPPAATVTVTTTVTTTTVASVVYSCDAQDLEINTLAIEPGFELDPQQTWPAGTGKVTVSVALKLWDVTHPATFLEQEGFNRWKEAVGVSEHLAASIIADVDDQSFGLSQFRLVREWILSWTQNSLTESNLQRLWFSRNKNVFAEPLDIGLDEEDIQVHTTSTCIVRTCCLACGWRYKLMVGGIVDCVFAMPRSLMYVSHFRHTFS